MLRRRRWARDLLEVVRLVVAAWCGECERDARRGRDAAQTGIGRGEDEPAYALGRLMRQLRSEDAAERHAEDVDAVVAEGVEDVLHRSGEATHPAWNRYASEPPVLGAFTVIVCTSCPSSADSNGVHISRLQQGPAGSPSREGSELYRVRPLAGRRAT